MPETRSVIPSVVFDTSILVAIAGRPAGNFATWKAVVDQRLNVFTSPAALEELSDVLHRPTIREHYGVSLDPLNIRRFIDMYRGLATLIMHVPEHFVLKADPKDSWLINLAIESHATYLLTYDETHILCLRDRSHAQHQEIKTLAANLQILKPAELSMSISSWT